MVSFSNSLPFFNRKIVVLVVEVVDSSALRLPDIGSPFRNLSMLSGHLYLFIFLHIFLIAPSRGLGSVVWRPLILTF